jgi:hypothetical protein
VGVGVAFGLTLGDGEADGEEDSGALPDCGITGVAATQLGVG